LVTLERPGDHREIAECVRARWAYTGGGARVLTRDHKVKLVQMIHYLRRSDDLVLSVVDFKQKGKNTEVTARAKANMWGERHIDLAALRRYVDECSS
jgi:hypothetical protein